MIKSVALLSSFALFVIGASPAMAANPATGKVGLDIDGKRVMVSRSQIRSKLPGALSAYRRAIRSTDMLAIADDGVLPLGCVRFPLFVVCSHNGYYCAVGHPAGHWDINCGKWPDGKVGKIPQALKN